MDEGSSLRIRKLRRRKGLAEDGARHIISEGEIARQRYHSELENAVRHIKNSITTRRRWHSNFDSNEKDLSKNVMSTLPRRWR